MNQRWKFLAASALAAALIATLGSAARAQVSGLSGGTSSGTSGGLGSSSGLGGSSGATSLTGGTTLGSTGGVGTQQGIGSGNISALSNGATGLSSLTNLNKGGANGYPTSTNPNLNYYYSPLFGGITSTNSSETFGQPIYPITATANTLTTNKASASTGFTTVGVRKVPSYVTTVGDDLPMVKHSTAELEQSARNAIAQSSAFKFRNAIAVRVDGNVVTLKGKVETERERRIAESLMRLTNGVGDVRNELVVAPAMTLPAPNPLNP